MEVVKTEDFQRALKRLPREIQTLYITQEKRFRENWRDHRLHIKKVRELANVLSLRVTRRYRVFFYFQTENTAIFFDIDHRKDAYK